MTVRKCGRLTVVVASIALMAFAAAPAKAAFEIGTFGSASGDYSYASDGTIAGTTITGTTGGTWTFDTEAQAILGVPGTPFNNAQMTVDLAALSFVVAAGPLHVQSFSGSFTVLDLDSGDLLLGADFTLGFGGGVLGGNNFILSAGTVIGAITYTSDFFDATQLVDPKGITFTLSNLIPSLALTGPVGSQVFVDFDSPDTANFNASVAVPEPATLLSAVPLMVVGGLWLRRRKAA